MATELYLFSIIINSSIKSFLLYFLRSITLELYLSSSLVSILYKICVY